MITRVRNVLLIIVAVYCVYRGIPLILSINLYLGWLYLIFAMLCLLMVDISYTQRLLESIDTKLEGKND